MKGTYRASDGGACASGRTRLSIGAAVVAAALVTSTHAQTIPLSPTAQASGAQITYSHGIEFVTIPGSTLNAQPWQGNGTPGDMSIGRGAVAYDYRIARFEVTFAQWIAFTNVLNGVNVTVPPEWAMRPVGGITWHRAAMYCNWLHNGRQNDYSTLLYGAYDVSTFGSGPNGFTDQITRSPGARFWIPSLDEWLMAAHYDPNRHGQGQGGWWTYSHTSDVQPRYGLPGTLVGGLPAQANAGMLSPFPHFEVSLGSYPDVQSPWGLLDTAGATAEWLEEVFFGGGWPTARGYDGSYTGTSPASARAADLLGFIGGTFPADTAPHLGLRIASAVPTPGTCTIAVIWIHLAIRRRRRGEPPWRTNVSFASSPQHH